MIIDDEKSLDMLLIAEDPQSRVVLEVARKVAKSTATVLISGETGVGKELIARYIHQHSQTSNGPYVSVNCAALPDNMIEALLFGYEKGAFTGAVNTYIGKFEQAQNGTLLLDEIAELPIELQAKLLRVLQERQIERLGGKKLININARVIAATNRDLRQYIMEGNFRSDLYYRLNVISLHCEALKNRSLDIVPLAEYFVKKYSRLLNNKELALTVQAKKKLLEYSWPGNVRELENVIQRSVVMNSSDIIDAENILLNEDDLNMDHNNFQFTSKVKEQEAKVILDALHETSGCREAAAKKLHMSPRTLRYKISKFKSMGLKVP